MMNTKQNKHEFIAKRFPTRQQFPFLILSLSHDDDILFRREGAWQGELELAQLFERLNPLVCATECGRASSSIKAFAENIYYMEIETTITNCTWKIRGKLIVNTSVCVLQFGVCENVEQEIANYGKTSAQAEQGPQRIALVSTFAKQGHKPKVSKLMRVFSYLIRGLVQL